MNEENPDTYLLGEVWEDGTTKIAYSQRRKYLLGRETNGLMNYPFRHGADGVFARRRRGILPRQHGGAARKLSAPAFYGAMNFLSTHDTPRLLTILGLTPPRRRRATSARSISSAIPTLRAACRSSSSRL